MSTPKWAATLRLAPLPLDMASASTSRRGRAKGSAKVGGVKAAPGTGSVELWAAAEAHFGATLEGWIPKEGQPEPAGWPSDWDRANGAPSWRKFCAVRGHVAKRWQGGLHPSRGKNQRQSIS